jgi:hypothetical protein
MRVDESEFALGFIEVASEDGSFYACICGTILCGRVSRDRTMLLQPTLSMSI